MLRVAVRTTTFVLLFGLMVQSVWWCFIPDEPIMQPVNALLAVSAAISGIPADRLATAAERRRRALLALRHELGRNRSLLADACALAQRPGYGQIYPRLILDALDTAALLSALSPIRDQAVLARVMDWRGTAADLNRRLEMTELRLCSGEPVDRSELALLRDIAGRPDGPFAQASSSLEELHESIDRSLRWGRR
ncbi:hypothetical protein [Streptomyces sp. NPDC001714]|uniref:hypothetical protein n=1 Tax=Streptomyces sp. NPDC001714 TaxID=3364603 RepID=UPI003689ECE9